MLPFSDSAAKRPRLKLDEGYRDYGTIPAAFAKKALATGTGLAARAVNEADVFLEYMSCLDDPADPAAPEVQLQTVPPTQEVNVEWPELAPADALQPTPSVELVLAPSPGFFEGVGEISLEASVGAPADSDEDSSDDFKFGYVKEISLNGDACWISTDPSDEEGSKVYMHFTVADPSILALGQPVAFKLHVGENGQPQASYPAWRLAGKVEPGVAVSWGEHVGMVASISTKGTGFVRSPEIHSKFGRDAHIHTTVMAKCGIKLGDKIRFDATLGDKDIPQVQAPVWKECPKGDQQSSFESMGGMNGMVDWGWDWGTPSWDSSWDGAWDGWAGKGKGLSGHASWDGKGFSGKCGWDGWFGKGGFDGKGFDGKGFDGKGFDGKGFDGKGFDGKGFDGKGSDGKGFDGKGFDGKGFGGKGNDGKGFDGKGFDGKGFDGKGFGGKGFDAKGFDGKGFDGKGFDGKGGWDTGYAGWDGAALEGWDAGCAGWKGCDSKGSWDGKGGWAGNGGWFGHGIWESTAGLDGKHGCNGKNEKNGKGGLNALRDIVGGSEMPVMARDTKMYVGSVQKDQNEEADFFWVKCPDTGHRKDVYVQRSLADPSKFSDGDWAAFLLEWNEKGEPQAQADAPFWKLVGRLDFLVGSPKFPKYTGMIRQIADDGSSYVDCELAKKDFGQDIHVHKAVIGECALVPDTMISFDVHRNGVGQPQVSSPLWICIVDNPLEKLGALMAAIVPKGKGKMGLSGFGSEARVVLPPQGLKAGGPQVVVPPPGLKAERRGPQVVKPRQFWATEP